MNSAERGCGEKTSLSKNLLRANSSRHGINQFNFSVTVEAIQVDFVRVVHPVNDDFICR